MAAKVGSRVEAAENTYLDYVSVIEKEMDTMQSEVETSLLVLSDAVKKVKAARSRIKNIRSRLAKRTNSEGF